MTLAEIYSLLTLAFASNFKSTPHRDDFKNLKPNWLIQNETFENKTGRELWQKAIKNADFKAIEADFKSLDRYFDMSYFMLINENDMNEYFAKLRYEVLFKDIKSSHISNLLGFVFSSLKSSLKDGNSKELAKFLDDKFLESAIAFSYELKTHASSDFYKALGYLFADYLNMLKLSVGKN